MAYEAWIEPEPESKIQRPPGFGKRHIFALLAFIGICLSYSMRFNLSICIVAMVNTTKSNSNGRNSNNTMSSSSGSSSIAGSAGGDSMSSTTNSKEICPTDSIYHDDAGENGTTVPIMRQIQTGEFHWDEQTKGIILGAFFWGYLITQLPGGLMAQRFGGKWLFGLGQLIAAVAGLFIPILAYQGAGYVKAIRIIQGLCGGITIPATHNLISNWIPPDERGKFSTIIYAGMPFGSAITLLISGYIIHFMGWAAVFYITGIITIIWFIFWTIMTFGKPSEHPTITEAEFNFIESKIGESMCKNTKDKIPTPWKEIFTSIPVWAILITHPCCTWGHYTFLIEIPSYLKSALHFDMKNNAWISACPHLLSWLISLILIYTGDALVARKIITTGTVRKINMTFALWGSAAMLIGVAFSGCNYIVTLIFLTFAVGCVGGVYGGVLCNHIDIAPNFAGILLGMSNTLATIPGFLSPALAGVILKGDPSIGQWRKVFLMSAGIQIFGNFVYIFFGSGKEQAWNRGKTSNQVSVISENNNQTTDPQSEQQQPKEKY